MKFLHPRRGWRGRQISGMISAGPSFCSLKPFQREFARAAEIQIKRIKISNKLLALHMRIYLCSCVKSQKLEREEGEKEWEGWTRYGQDAEGIVYKQMHFLFLCLFLWPAQFSTQLNTLSNNKWKYKLKCSQKIGS